MSAARRARALAARLGATIEDASGGTVNDYIIDAPPGKLWFANDCHCLVVSWFRGPAAWTEEAWRGALLDMEGGLIDCPMNEECEYGCAESLARVAVRP